MVGPASRCGRVLEDAARVADLIERMQEELDADAPFVMKGSMGQPTASPLVSEIRQHRGTLTLLGRSNA